MQKPWFALTILFLLGIVWGTGYSIARFAMTHGVNPLGYSFWQSIGPAVLIGLSVLIRQKKMAFNFAHCRYYFVCGLTGIALPNTIMYFAAPHLPAGLLAVIVNTVPIMAYLMALVAKVEFFCWRRFLAVCVALSGLLLLLMPTVNYPTAESAPWVLFALLTPLCFAFCAVYITRFRPEGSDSFSLAAGTLISSSLILAPIVFASQNFYVFNWPLMLPDWVILLEILLSSLGYVLFFKLIKIAGPVYYSFVDSIVALTGLFWGYLIFNEHLTLRTGAAVFFILAALIMISKRQKSVITYDTST